MITGTYGNASTAVAGKRYDSVRLRDWQQWQDEWESSRRANAIWSLIGLLDFLFNLDVDQESTQGVFGFITPHADVMVERVVFLLELIRDLSVLVSASTDQGEMQAQLLVKARAVLVGQVFRPEMAIEPYWHELLEGDEVCRDLVLEYFAVEGDVHGGFRIPGIRCLEGDAAAWARSFAANMAWSGFLRRNAAQSDYLDILAGLGRLELVAHRDNWRKLTYDGWVRLVALALWPLQTSEMTEAEVEEALQAAVTADSELALLCMKARAKRRQAAGSSSR